MDYKITLKDKKFSMTGALPSFLKNDIAVYGDGLEKGVLADVFWAYEKRQLTSFFDSLLLQNFVVFIHDKEKLFIVSDKFGTKEIFYSIVGGELLVSNKIENVTENKNLLKYNNQALYELIMLFTIAPPRTVYEDVFAVPMATILKYEEKNICSVARYWNVEKHLNSKEFEYDKHINLLRKKFLDTFKYVKGEGLAVALSGGIDSGAIVGMAKEVYGKAPMSVTYGGHGENTPDLESSRLTLKETGSLNEEIYPSFEALKKLPEYMSSLEQPIIADLVFPNMMIYENLERKKVSTAAFGFGAEMLLGNLKISRIYKKLQYLEAFTPKTFLNFFYRIAGKVLKLSQNQKDFLLSNSWEQRFLLARGPLFTREKYLYKQLPKNFLEILEQDLKEKVGNGKVKMIDRFVMMYLFGWVNYLQLRDFYAMGKKSKISPFSPFDTPIVAEQLFRTPDAFRKLNNWNKQVLRDVSKIFVSNRLYKREVRSLIVPYTKFFSGKEKLFFKYLAKSSLVTNIIDLENFISDYKKLPEPGLTLIRLLGIAVWDDVKKGNSKSLEAFALACAEAEKSEG